MEKSALIDVGRPLCVDLDGTLVKSDTLVDSLLLLARSKPAALLQTPGWALKGKAHLKEQVTSLVSLNVEHLPYNRKLLEYLMTEHGAGRRLYLATGADGRIAHRVAKHLGIFEDVLCSDGKTNLTGRNKLASFRERFGTASSDSEGGFDYIGNARPDLPLLAAATEPMLANPDMSLRVLLKQQGVTARRVFIDRGNPLKILTKAVRVHQWAKNALIFLPLLLAHTFKAKPLIAACIAFLSFSLCASATYIINDLLDIEADRLHPKTRLRAFASGNLSAFTGLAICFTFLVLAFGMAWMIPHAFFNWLCLYLVTTLAYSLALKRVVIVDVVILSALYTLRMLAGAAATETYITPWLSAFSIFIFLSLAMVKRFSELQNLRSAGATVANGRGYLLGDIEQVRAFGTSSAYASVVVFALYIASPENAGLYHHSARMWLMTPLMILWLSRVWLLASRGELDEDPVVFALTDRVSLVMGIAVVLIAILSL
jgi:4-hydroxybenzoate polyprenyltransferase/phosphoserine phosphatase